MTNKEAIKILERLQDPDPGEGTLTEEAWTALQMAIDKLEEPEEEVLKDCPFCGGKACIMQYVDDEYPWEIRYIRCACRTGQFTKVSAAVSAWNRRAE